MTKFKKIRNVVITALVIVLAISPFAYLANQAYDFLTGMSGYQIESFWKYRKDFKLLGEMFYEEYMPVLKENEDISEVLIEESGDQLHIKYLSASPKCFSYVDEFYIDMDDRTKACYESVHEALPSDHEGYGWFWHVRVVRDQVVFATYGDYAIIYSHKRPTCIQSPDEKYDSYVVERKGWNLYQALGKIDF